MRKQIEMSKRILVIGDLMLDKYYDCDIYRISPEAPVPILNYKSHRHILGGASNVANNLAANYQSVSILGVVGDDDNGNTLVDLLEQANIYTKYIVREKNKVTTTKGRFVSAGQQIFRFDQEDVSPISLSLEELFILEISNVIEEYDLVVISDYKKGLLSKNFVQKTIKICNEYNKPVLIDPKDTDFEKYKSCTLFKPNKKELEGFIGRKVENSEDAIEMSLRLKKNIDCKYFVLTLGAEGMIFIDTQSKVTRIPAEVHEVFDVTGAGDTVLAFLAMGFKGDQIDVQAVKIANIAASIKVGKRGTAVVKEIEVLENINKIKKIITLEEINHIVSVLKAGDKKIVFTNGCFDILHAGHVKLLCEAKKLGDILVLGLNSDNSVRQLKGEMRPIIEQSERAELLAALECVDFVVIFEEDTPIELLRIIRPDILVKGGDYALEKIIGYDLVTEYGGTVTTIPILEGKSTSNIIKKISAM